MHFQGGPKNCTPNVSEQIVLQRVPVKLVLSDLSVTQAYNILDYCEIFYLLNIRGARAIPTRTIPTYATHRETIFSRILTILLTHGPKIIKQSIVSFFLLCPQKT